jgi:hypothetical protein
VGDDALLLDLGRSGSRIAVRLGEAYSPGSPDPAQAAWRHAGIEVEAFPFAGTIRTVLTGPDIEAYAALAAEFTGGRRDRVVLGGDRAAEVVLQRHDGTVEVSVTPSGDDPWPLLRFLIFPD